ncbi:hypothetical protein PUN28_002867 [Cardiocondyla obscurior]|uniref:Uncharacterized protein n=1 Tax=Cardiocondyla obscurior TaxID=286306 RepID=A0AAW2GWG4_9HYME
MFLLRFTRWLARRHCRSDVFVINAVDKPQRRDLDRRRLGVSRKANGTKTKEVSLTTRRQDNDLTGRPIHAVFHASVLVRGSRLRQLSRDGLGISAHGDKAAIISHTLRAMLCGSRAEKKFSHPLPLSPFLPVAPRLQ